MSLKTLGLFLNIAEEMPTPAQTLPSHHILQLHWLRCPSSLSQQPFYFKRNRGISLWRIRSNCTSLNISMVRILQFAICCTIQAVFPIISVTGLSPDAIRKYEAEHGTAPPDVIEFNKCITAECRPVGLSECFELIGELPLYFEPEPREGTVIRIIFCSVTFWRC